MATNSIDRAMAQQLLERAVASHKDGKAGVSRRLGPGCGRSLISRVLSSNDPTEISEKMARRVIECFHVIPHCPAIDGEQPLSECARIALGKAPTHNPQAMRIWKTCQTCPHKPEVSQ